MCAHNDCRTNTPSKCEEYCISQFEHWLRTRQPSISNTHWEYVPKPKQPPDFYMTIDSQGYAVEVTTAMHHEKVGDKRWSDPGIANTHSRFTASVKQKALQAGILEGIYDVDCQAPVENFPALQGELESRILDYVRQTKSMSSHPVEEIKIDGRCVYRVEKVGSGSPEICASAGLDCGGWQDDIRRDTCEILKRCISEKREKLKRLNLPIILLLHDAYYLAESSIWRECAQRLAITKVFHTIYVAQNNSVGFVLCSQEKGWLGT